MYILSWPLLFRLLSTNFGNPQTWSGSKACFFRTHLGTEGASKSSSRGSACYRHAFFSFLVRVFCSRHHARPTVTGARERNRHRGW